MPALDIRIQVLLDVYLAAGLRTAAIAGSHHKINIQRHIYLAYQVGKKHHRALQDTHHQQILAFVVPCQLLPHLTAFGSQCRFIKHHACQII